MEVDWMPAPGEIFGHYRIEEKLGEGAFGAVFRGTDIRLHRQVAIKIPHGRGQENDEAWGRLLREARAASALNHPNICATYDVSEEDEVGYIAMEYVEGRTVSELVSGGPLPPATALSYGAQMAGALAHAHGRGIIHRDLKGSNVIVTAEGQAKLLDFGLARPLESGEIETATKSTASLAALGSFAGTLCYMAPEVLRGKPASPRSDLWSLGALLYEMLAARLPFRGETPFELSLAIMTETPPPLEVPRGIKMVVEKCLEKDPARRYGGGEEVLRDLEAARAALDEKSGRFSLRRWALAACALLAIVLALGLAWRHRGRAARLTAPAISIVPPAQPKPGVTPSPAAQPAAAAAAHAPRPQPSRQFAGNATAMVWVNTKTGVYHCPGDSAYGKTAAGVKMKQIVAQQKGYRAARNKPCK